MLLVCSPPSACSGSPARPSSPSPASASSRACGSRLFARVLEPGGRPSSTPSAPESSSAGSRPTPAVLQNSGHRQHLDGPAQRPSGAIGGIGILFWTSARLTLLMLAVVPLVAIGRGDLRARGAPHARARRRTPWPPPARSPRRAWLRIRTVRSFAREERHDRSLRRGGSTPSIARPPPGPHLRSVPGRGPAFWRLRGGIGGLLWYGGRLVLAGHDHRRDG